MTSKQHSFNGRVAGATIANDEFTIVGGDPAQRVYSNDSGNIVARFGGPVITATYVNSYAHDQIASPMLSWAARIRIPQQPSAATIIHTNRNSTAATNNLLLSIASGSVNLRMRDAASIAVATTPTLVLNTWYIVQCAVQVGTTTSNGKLWTRFSRENDGVELSSGELTTANLGTTDLIAFQIGKQTNNDIVVEYDAINLQDGVYLTNANALSPVSVSNTPPTVTLDAAKTNLEPWSDVQHTATIVDEEDGTSGNVVWTVENTNPAGIPVALTGATSRTVSYQAPATLNGCTVTLGCVPTDSNGLSGIKKTVTDSILYTTDRIVLNGVQVPIKKILASDLS